MTAERFVGVRGWPFVIRAAARGERAEQEKRENGSDPSGAHTL
jgi:hypothetical protein